jgi:hypothetical protein
LAGNGYPLTHRRDSKSGTQGDTTDGYVNVRAPPR